MCPQFPSLSLQVPSDWIISKTSVLSNEVGVGVIVLKQEIWGRTHRSVPGPTSPDTALEESPCENCPPPPLKFQACLGP